MHQVKVGQLHDRAVGPHPKPSFQVVFNRVQTGEFLPWLMLNHDALSVLIHPFTGEHYDDHTVRAAWLGAPVPLRLQVFSEFEARSQASAGRA